MYGHCQRPSPLTVPSYKRQLRGALTGAALPGPPRCPKPLHHHFTRTRNFKTTGQLMETRAGYSISRPAPLKSSSARYNPF